MKKYAFFKYFIKKLSFRGWGRGRKICLIGGGVECSILPLIWFGEEGGAGTEMLKPAPTRPVAMSIVYAFNQILTY